MGCWVCNPLCGRCRKELKAPKKCPTCGAYNIRGYYVDNKCNQCGNELGIGYHWPVRCRYTGLICGRACSRSKVLLPHGEVRACENRIIVKKKIPLKGCRRQRDVGFVLFLHEKRGQNLRPSVS